MIRSVAGVAYCSGFLFARSLQFLQRGRVILFVESGFADVIMRLRGRGGLRIFLEQLLEGFAHSLGMVGLAEEQRFLLERGFALARLGVAAEQRLQIIERGSYCFFS